MAIGKTYTIKLDDKAAFLNRLQKQQIQVNADDIQDNTLNHTFTITIHDPDQVQVIDQLLQQSKDIDDNPSTKLPPLKNHDVKEIKIVPNLGSFVSFNGKTMNKRSSEGSKIIKLSWQEALDKKIFSSVTLKYLTTIFINLLGITPEKVYIENNPIFDRPSLYVKANYNGEELMYVKKSGKNGGQDFMPKLYSKYTNIPITQYIQYGLNPKSVSYEVDPTTNKLKVDDKNKPVLKGKEELDKENLLRLLKIPGNEQKLQELRNLIKKELKEVLKNGKVK